MGAVAAVGSWLISNIATVGAVAGAAATGYSAYSARQNAKDASGKTGSMRMPTTQVSKEEEETEVNVGTKENQRRPQGRRALMRPQSSGSQGGGGALMPAQGTGLRV